MRKLVLLMVLMVLLQNSFAFAEKKLDAKDPKFDIKSYENNSFSNEITLSFEGVIEEDSSYEMTVNKKDNFTIEVAKNKDDKEKESHYQIKVFDENGKLVNTSNIKKVGEFSEADLDFNLGEYINVAMGYDIEIENTSNGAKIVISAAPSIGYFVIVFYAVFALFWLLKTRKG